MAENTNALKDFSTSALVEELKKREGVEVEEYGPYEAYQVEGEGPAIVLTVID